MNYFLGACFLISGLLILFKPLYEKLTDYFILKLNIAGLLNIAFGSAIFIYGISQPDWSERLWSIIFIVFGVIAVIKGFLLFFFPRRSEKLTRYFVQHYYKFVLPMSAVYIFLSLLTISTDYIGPQNDINKCESDSYISVLCGFSNPEDIEITPDKKFLFMSEFGGIGPYEEPSAGYFAMLDLESNKKIVPEIVIGNNDWGNPECSRSTSDRYGPHGIDMVQRNDDSYQIGVINHFPRESIEMFELSKKDSSWSLTWRGCINVPDEYYFNDIGLKKDGSFYASHMYKRDITFSEWLMVTIFKSNSGHVVLWEGDEFKKIPNSDGSGPNGITLDEVENLLYISYNQGDQIVIFDLSENIKVKSYFVQSPDNIHLESNSAWITSLDFQPNDIGDCDKRISCSLPFSVHELDRNSLELKNKYSFSKTVFGLPTVAVPVNEKIYMGSFHSDRIGYFIKE